MIPTLDIHRNMEVVSLTFRLRLGYYSRKTSCWETVWSKEASDYRDLMTDEVLATIAIVATSFKGEING